MEDRRDFIKKAAALTALSLVGDWALAKPASDKLGKKLPERQLTRNGEKVTSFNLGGYHVGLTDKPKEAQKLIERSLELGVRFFDNARGYNKGRSEEYYGQFLTPKYRDEVFIMTKAPEKSAEGVKRQLEESLIAMKTDYVDLWQIHAIRDIKDVDNRINNGVLDVFLEAKQKGLARYIGFTGHVNPRTHLYFLKRLDELGVELDTCQLPLNVCDPSFESFETDVLPELLKRKYGVIAMKTMAGGSMIGNRIDTTPKDIKTDDIPNLIDETALTLANLHQYVYSLPISSLCSGCRTIEELDHNVKVLKKMGNLSESDKEKMIALAKPYAGLVVENYKRVLDTEGNIVRKKRG
ncbi:aldo/keto reductase [Marinilabilia sp.]